MPDIVILETTKRGFSWRQGYSRLIALLCCNCFSALYPLSLYRRIFWNLGLSLLFGIQLVSVFFVFFFSPSNQLKLVLSLRNFYSEKSFHSSSIQTSNAKKNSHSRKINAREKRYRSLQSFCLWEYRLSLWWDNNKEKNKTYTLLCTITENRC